MNPFATDNWDVFICLNSVVPALEEIEKESV
jgi:hypothetical protein